MPEEHPSDTTTVGEDVIQDALPPPLSSMFTSVGGGTVAGGTAPLRASTAPLYLINEGAAGEGGAEGGVGAAGATLPAGVPPGGTVNMRQPAAAAPPAPPLRGAGRAVLMPRRGRGRGSGRWRGRVAQYGARAGRSGGALRSGGASRSGGAPRSGDAGTAPTTGATESPVYSSDDGRSPRSGGAVRFEFFDPATPSSWRNTTSAAASTSAPLDSGSAASGAIPPPVLSGMPSSFSTGGHRVVSWDSATPPGGRVVSRPLSYQPRQVYHVATHELVTVSPSSTSPSSDSARQRAFEHEHKDSVIVDLDPPARGASRAAPALPQQRSQRASARARDRVEAPAAPPPPQQVAAASMLSDSATIADYSVSGALVSGVNSVPSTTAAPSGVAASAAGALLCCDTL